MRPSDKELAELLREAANMIDRLAPRDIRKSFHERNFAQNSVRATADALEREPAAPVMTWEERMGRAANGFDAEPSRGHGANRLTRMSATLRAAFPEYAPKE